MTAFTICPPPAPAPPIPTCLRTGTQAHASLASTAPASEASATSYHQVTAPHPRDAPTCNSHGARGTAGAKLPATSCLGAFWTPAPERNAPHHCRRPKTCTAADISLAWVSASCPVFAARQYCMGWPLVARQSIQRARAVPADVPSVRKASPPRQGSGYFIGQGSAIRRGKNVTL